jgi:hypothetical protein
MNTHVAIEAATSLNRAIASDALDAMPFGPLARRQRMLDQVSDPAVKKILVMRWLEKREIWGDEAEQLIKDNGLEAA